MRLIESHLHSSAALSGIAKSYQSLPLSSAGVGCDAVMCGLSTESNDEIASFEHKPQFLVHN